VLLTGESGTGKELVAEALHESSPRHAGPLVRVNCAALVETLLVSELFGHEKGAFTGAHERKKGRFELAHGGTLFLDEIGDISPAVQAALLRVLQERRFERVGGRESIDVDVRIVAATNRDLEAMVRAGTFREDLYYRLNEVRIEMPPLRERRSDVPALVAHLLGRVAEERGEPEKRVSAEALELLAHQSWPGNVRQLENALRVASLFADGSLIETVHLNGTLTAVSAGAAADTATDRPVTVAADDDGPDPYDRVRSGELSLRALKKEIERSCIERALVECDGNISKAAGVLGMKRPRLSQLVKEYGLLVGDEG
jgi:transcriptional regulator with GAF, ATPase, and Fis domain